MMASEPGRNKASSALRAKLKSAASADLAKAFQLPIKFERRDALSAVKKKFAAEFVGEGEGKVPATV